MNKIIIITIPKLCQTDYGYYPDLLRGDIKRGYVFYTKYPGGNFYKVVLRIKDLLIGWKLYD